MSSALTKIQLANITEEKLWEQMAKPLREIHISKSLALDI